MSNRIGFSIAFEKVAYGSLQSGTALKYRMNRRTDKRRNALDRPRPPAHWSTVARTAGSATHAELAKPSIRLARAPAVGDLEQAGHGKFKAGENRGAIRSILTNDDIRSIKTAYRHRSAKTVDDPVLADP
jgi:hypothetical protein